VTKLNPTGSALVYSTYLGGTDGEAGEGIAVDASGNTYVAGQTFSTDFPTTPGAFQTTRPGGQDAFVTKLNPTGSALVYSTYLGGNLNDNANGIAVDASGNAYVTGGSDGASPNFPTTSDAFQTTGGGPFMTKLNSTGSALVYSTFLGTGGTAVAIALDAAGSAYFVGYSMSTTFPTTSGAFQTTNNGGWDAFVAKFTFGPTYMAQIQQPINPDGSSVFSVKRGVVPVKFTLTSDGVATCQLPAATISLTRTAGTAVGSIDESTYLLASDSGSNFRIDTTNCQYVYNLATSSLGTGTYQVNISIGGVVVGSGTFALK
jgi:hypothetical protein